jgi:hypothetical protein
MFLSPPFFHLPRRNFICTRISGSPANVLLTRCYDSCLVRKTNFLAATDKIPRRLEEGYCLPSVERPEAALCIMHPAFALRGELVKLRYLPRNCTPQNPFAKLEIGTASHRSINSRRVETYHHIICLGGTQALIFRQYFQCSPLLLFQ